MSALLSPPDEGRSARSRFADRLPPATTVPIATDAGQVTVVCAARDATLAGAAVGLALAERRAARCAVVLEWTAGLDRRFVAAPATRSARRAAVALASGGLAATASGRLVRVTLPAAESAIAVATTAVLAAVPDTPTVLTVAGPRGEEADVVIAAGDAALLVTRPEADQVLVALALAELAALSKAVAAVELVAAPVAALLARSGLRLAAPLRERFLDAV